MSSPQGPSQGKRLVKLVTAGNPRGGGADCEQVTDLWASVSHRHIRCMSRQAARRGLPLWQNPAARRPLPVGAAAIVSRALGAANGHHASGHRSS